MIEVLMKYIQDKGYRVDALLSVLLIRKEAYGKVYGKYWAISPDELSPEFEKKLRYEADTCCEMIEQAIQAAT